VHETKTGVVRILKILHHRPMLSHIIEGSCRDLLNAAAEHGSILKNNKNTKYPHFSFTPETAPFPETDVLF